jgi:RimJ/RimL family protein N-acetyltransferase
MLVPTLKTDRLRIRPLTVNDLSVCHQLYLDTRWADQGLPDERNLQIRRNWLEWTIRNYTELDRLNQPPYGDRAVELGENGRLIGLVGLVPLLAPFAQLPTFGSQMDPPFSAEVGLFWMISPAMQGRGFATEGARALVSFAFDVLKVGRILAGTEYDNFASIAVMRKIGMRIERNPFPSPAWFQITGILQRERHGLGSEILRRSL